jgi:hypothetical protein
VCLQRNIARCAVPASITMILRLLHAWRRGASVGAVAGRRGLLTRAYAEGPSEVFFPCESGGLEGLLMEGSLRF